MSATWPLRIATLALLILFPVAWLAPLARARVLPLFSGSEITILGGVIELSKSDVFLCAIVAIFAILIPHDNRRAAKIVAALGKLSMTDVFLIAVYVVAVKGVGIGQIDIQWGLYLFTVLVLVSIAVSWATLRTLSGSET